MRNWTRFQLFNRETGRSEPRQKSARRSGVKRLSILINLDCRMEQVDDILTEVRSAVAAVIAGHEHASMVDLDFESGPRPGGVIMLDAPDAGDPTAKF